MKSQMIQLPNKPINIKKVFFSSLKREEDLIDFKNHASLTFKVLFSLKKKRTRNIKQLINQILKYTKSFLYLNFPINIMHVN